MTSNRFDHLIAAWEERIKRAFIESIHNLRDAAHIEQIARMLERGDVDGALRAVGLDPVAFRPLDKTLTAAFEAGGVATAKTIPTIRDAQGFRVVFQFNIRNPAAETWLSENSTTLVREIVDDQRIMIREYLRAGMAKGLNPRTVALDLVGRIGASGVREGGTIGLTSSQEAWVRNYADELASERPTDALKRTLRDKRFDRAVIKAAEAKQPIPADLRAKMVTAYRNRALRYRAEAIARTEAMASLHESQEQAMRQAVNSGVVDQDAVAYVWNTAGDDRVRDTHAAMDGQVRKMGEDFVTGSGAHLRFPGDPFAPPSEVINCRCWREPKVDFLAGVR